MGQPYSTVLISPPIIRLSSLSRSFSHSLTGSVPEAVLKNLAGRIFSESFMHMLYHIWYNMSSLWLRGKKGKGACAGYSGHPFRKRRLESDLQAHSVCRRALATVESESNHTFHTLVGTLLSSQRRSLCSTFSFLFSILFRFLQHNQ